MGANWTTTESVPVVGRYDVVVAGGGVAGVAAALAARRAGKSVLLLEKTNLLGGLATIGLVNLFVPMCNGRGKQVIRGMAEEFLRLSIRHGYGSPPDDWKNGEPDKPTEQRYVTRFSPGMFAIELVNLLLEEGADLRLDCLATRPIMAGGRCEGVVAISKSGAEGFEAGVVIDATGDADLLARSGMPTVTGGNYFTYYGLLATLDNCAEAARAGSIHLLYNFVSGDGAHANLYGKGHPEGMPLIDGTNGQQVSDYLVAGQRKLREKLLESPRESRDPVLLPTMPQLRTTRRIDGDYALKVDDAYRHFDDSVCAICDFDRRDFLFEVPLRCLTRSGFDNLMGVGRVAAAEGYAWDVLRVIPPAILTGQAAGAAAALALESGRPVHAVDVAELQRRLKAADVLIHFDDAWVPAEGAAAEGSASPDIGHI